jgi:uncharacterized membrane protein
VSDADQAKERANEPAVARTRVLVAFACGIAAFVVAMAFMAWQVALMLGWSVAAATIVVWVFVIVRNRDGRETARLATREDDSRFVADLILVSAAVASLVAGGGTLLKAAESKGVTQAAITAVAVFGVIASWAVVHSTFMLRYARLYYAEGGGVDFNEDNDPDYRDFAYLALTIGMTFQVSDTNLTAKSIRRTATRHALLSYLFGAVVVALVINVVAGLLNR